MEHIGKIDWPSWDSSGCLLLLVANAAINFLLRLLFFLYSMEWHWFSNYSPILQSLLHGHFSNFSKTHPTILGRHSVLCPAINSTKCACMRILVAVWEHKSTRRWESRLPGPVKKIMVIQKSEWSRRLQRTYDILPIRCIHSRTLLPGVMRGQENYLGNRPTGTNQREIR